MLTALVTIPQTTSTNDSPIIKTIIDSSVSHRHLIPSLCCFPKMAPTPEMDHDETYEVVSDDEFDAL